MTTKDKKIIEDSERDGIPIFVLTAKDLLSVKAIEHYQFLCVMAGTSGQHITGVNNRIKEFKLWHVRNEKKIKLPD